METEKKTVVVWELYGKGRGFGVIPITPEAVRLIRILQAKVKPEEIPEYLTVYQTTDEARQAKTLTASDIQEILNSHGAEALEEKGIVSDPDYAGEALECTLCTSERCGKTFQPIILKLDKPDRHGNEHYGLNLILARREEYNFPEAVLARANNLTSQVEAVLKIEIPSTHFIIGVCQHCRWKAQAKVRAGERDAWVGYTYGKSFSQIRDFLYRDVKKSTYDKSLECHRKEQQPYQRFGRQIAETPPEVKKGAEQAITRGKARETVASSLNKLVKGMKMGSGLKKIIMAYIEADDDNPAETVTRNHELFGENREAYELFCKYVGTTPSVSETGQAVPVETATQ